MKDSRDKLKYDKTLVDISTTNNIDEVHLFCKLKLDRIINERRCFPDQKQRKEYHRDKRAENRYLIKLYTSREGAS